MDGEGIGGCLVLIVIAVGAFFWAKSEGKLPSWLSSSDAASTQTTMEELAAQVDDLGAQVDRLNSCIAYMRNEYDGHEEDCPR